MWKRKLEAVKFLRKHFEERRAGSGSKLGSDQLSTELEAEAKILYYFHIPG